MKLLKDTKQRIKVTCSPEYSHFRNNGKGIYDTFNNLIVIYYPNIKNSLDLFLTYFHEMLHYISWNLFRNKLKSCTLYERIIWFLLDYRKWYIKKERY